MSVLCCSSEDRAIRGIEMGWGQNERDWILGALEPRNKQGYAVPVVARKGEEMVSLLLGVVSTLLCLVVPSRRGFGGCLI